jgi:hypothetical protein
MKSLYWVESIIPEFKGRRDVSIANVVVHRPQNPHVDYGDAIRDYRPGEFSWMAEGAVDEWMSLAEAHQVLAYLQQGDDGSRHTIKEIRLPIEKSAIALIALPMDRNRGSVTYRDAANILPFQIEGFYDLRGSAFISPSDEANLITPKIFQAIKKIGLSRPLSDALSAEVMARFGLTADEACIAVNGARELREMMAEQRRKRGDTPLDQ